MNVVVVGLIVEATDVAIVVDGEIYEVESVDIAIVGAKDGFVVVVATEGVSVSVTVLGMNDGEFDGGPVVLLGLYDGGSVVAVDGVSVVAATGNDEGAPAVTATLDGVSVVAGDGEDERSSVIAIALLGLADGVSVVVDGVFVGVSVIAATGDDEGAHVVTSVVTATLLGLADGGSVVPIDGEFDGVSVVAANGDVEGAPVITDT